MSVRGGDGAGAGGEPPRDAGERPDRSPARLSSAVAVGAALAALLAAGGASVPALWLGVVGVAATAGGLLTGRRGGVTVGAAVLVLGALAAGLAGAPALDLLAATAGAVLAWDVGRNAVDVGHQLGRDAPTARIELLHAGASALVVSAAAALGHGVFRAVAGGRPALAVVGLLLAGGLLSYALR